MDGLSKPWHLVTPLGYVCLVLSLSLIVRLIHSCLAGLQYSHLQKLRSHKLHITTYPTWTESSYWAFHGFSPCPKSVRPNYWYQFIIGSAEMSAYPILIAVNSFDVIGVWIGFKAIVQWSTWITDRTIFNLFLIGNITTIFISFSLVKYVYVGID